MPKRFIVVVMCFAAMLICYLDRVSMSAAIIPMAAEYRWSATTKGWVLSSFFIGYLLGQIPGSWLVNRYGGRLVLGIALLWWSLMTFFTPIAAMSSLGVLITARILMGLGEAAVTPCLYNLAARWLPQQEQSRSFAFMISGIPAGTVLTLFLSGWMLTDYHWSIMFYTFGGCGIVFAFLWFRLIRGSPADHPGIGQEEKALLAGSGAITTSANPEGVPWGRLLRTRAVWALIFNHFCSNWALYVLLTWLPTYFSEIHDLGIGSAALYSSLPWLILLLFANLAAVLADRMIKKGVSVTHVRKIMQVAGLGGSAISLLFASYSQTPLLALLALCGAVGMLGLTWSGFGPNHLDIAPRYADVLSGLTNTAGTLPGIIGVGVTGWVIDLTGSFSGAFQLAAAVNIIGALVWLMWSTGKKIID